MFSWIDYFFILVMLATSTGAGIYYGCFGSKQRNPKEYLFGGKTLSSFPVGISVAVSLYSSMWFTAMPADVHKYGSKWMWNIVAILVASIALYYIYLPVFFKLQVTSSLEYLRRRFDNKTRSLALFLSFLKANLYLPIIIYSPSLCFATMASLNVHFIVIVVTSLCVIYTSFGGIKAVIWTDTFQLFMIWASLFSILGIGFKHESILNVWQTAVEGGRIDMLDFRIDLSIRDSFWSNGLVGAIQLIYVLGLTESGITKLLALPNCTRSKSALSYTVSSLIFIQIIQWLIGLQLHAKYANCDPLESHVIEKHDQLMPYYVKEISSGIYGVSGLFIAAVFSSSLSTISSMLNGISCITYNELIVKYLKPDFSDKSRNLILKAIVFMQGCISIALSLLVEHMGQLYPLALSFAGLTSGPLLGMITLGVLFPRANAFGAFYGGCFGFLVAMAYVVPASFHQIKGTFKYPSKSVSVEHCSDNNHSNNAVQNLANPLLHSEAATSFEAFFDISYYYYIAVAIVPTIVVGLLMSRLTQKRYPPVDEQFLNPFVLSILKKRSKSLSNLKQEQTRVLLETSTTPDNKSSFCSGNL